MADPTYENDLVLCTTKIKHDLLAREAAVTYALDDAGINNSAQQWADILQGSFADRWGPGLDNGAVITRTLTLKGDGTSTFTVGESTDAGTRGGSNLNTVAANSALLVKKLTGLGGKTNRGRMYVPWFVQDSAVDEAGHISSGEVADDQVVADAWFTDVGGSLVIANRHYDLPWNFPDRKLVSTTIGPLVTVLVVENVIATQRRRMPR